MAAAGSGLLKPGCLSSIMRLLVYSICKQIIRSLLVKVKFNRIFCLLK